jgi:hypothetical protein
VVVVVALPDLDMITPDFHGPDTVPEIVQFDEQLGTTTSRAKFCVAFEPIPLAAVITMG